MNKPTLSIIRTMMYFLKKYKYFLLALFLWVDSSFLFAQTTETYINKNCQVVPAEQASYIRKIVTDKMAERPTLYHITDYYLSGEVLMEAVAISLKNLVLDGKCTYYYKDGRKKSEGNFSENMPSGIWHYWSEHEPEPTIIEFDIFGKQTILKTSIKEPPAPDYAIVETDAIFPGETKAIDHFIKQNLVYPGEALSRNINGTVLVNFEIDQTGKTKNILLLTRCGFGMEEEAIRLISTMPAWTPAQSHGINIIVSKTIPVTFRIP